ncbi:MAG: hypothetical protein DMD68_02800 [Gemmatimonadetes bacterium]|nr:MAG: hypothetical protein DMD68_02800 [Gemmatimonadota bacterium]
MNTRCSRYPVRLATALVAVSLGCGSNPTAPATAGPIVASLVTPHTDDGALLVTVTGPGMSTVQAAGSGSVVFWRLVSATEVRVLVVGNLGAGPLFSMDVPDARKASEYASAVLEVASRADAILPTTAGYAVTFSGAAAAVVATR